ncbi:MAG: tetratricopeptide repeat protein [Mycobacterium sp.]
MADDAAAPEGKLTESTTDRTDPEGATESPRETDPSDTTDTTETVADADAAGSDDGDVVDFDEETANIAAAAPESMSPVKLALIIGVVVVVALGAAVGWLGYRAMDSRAAAEQRQVFLQVGRQAALNLTTIDSATVDADVQRILDSATDTFYDDFAARAQPFIDVVNQAQSKSVGEVTSAGLESDDPGGAQVLVAITVTTSNIGAPEQEPRAWRMRITVKQVEQDVKVSNVEFVP